MLAIVDPGIVDAFLERSLELYDGTLEPDPRGFCFSQDGLFIDTGGDDIFPCTAYLRDGQVHAFEVTLDDPEVEDARWVPVGQVHAPSGQVLVGDPGMLEQYVPDPPASAVDAHGVWTVLTLPAAGWIGVHVLKEQGNMEERNLALRLSYVVA